MKRFLRFLFPALALGILIFVWSVSISNNGGIAATFQTTSISILVYNLFKLAGLTAFTLVALQVLTGPYMHLWEKLYGPKFYRYHGYQGIFALLFAITHWFLITLYLKLIHVGVLQFDRNNFPLP